MRWPTAIGLIRLAFAVGFACASWLWGAGPAAAQTPVPIGEPGPIMNVAQHALRWVDEEGHASIDQVLQLPASRFTPNDPSRIDRLDGHATLWLKFRVQRKAGPREGDWLIIFALPLLDAVTVFQQTSDGRWLGQSAGDTIAVDQWPEAARYPLFRLAVPPGQSRDVYVRIAHRTPVSVPVEMGSAQAHHERMQRDYLGLGAAFGAFVILIAASALQAWVYRDRVYGLYSAYSVLVTLAVAAYTGLAAQFLWSALGTWADTSQGVLAILASASALLFVLDISAVGVRARWLARLMRWAAWGSVALAVAYAFVERAIGLSILALVFPGAVVLALFASAHAWRRGDAVGKWVFAAYVPAGLTLFMIQARIQGWMTSNWFNQNGIVVAMALQVPLLLLALNMRSRDRHGAQIREQAILSQDPLTGLLAEHLFHDRLRQAVARHRRHGDDAAIVFIDLVNYKRIRAALGTAVAERSLLRAVIKLRGLLRDVDTAARIGESRFGIIMEGVRSRGTVTDRGARLIASGLMPLKGLKPDVTLQFHIAAVVLCEKPAEAHEHARELADILEGMSPRTRRPIRFIEAEITQPAPLYGDSLGLGDEPSDLNASSGPGRDSVPASGSPIQSKP